MSRETIERHSKIYGFLRPYVDEAFKVYFNTTFVNMHNIPKDKPLIVTPNHQNALMDALAVLISKKWQPIFLGRADIFKKPLINKLLTFIKMLPVYRFRDGYSNLSNNDATFKKTIDVLKSPNPIVILPEGNHGEYKRLRALKKGVCRIALQAEEANDFKLDVHILPVGLDYSDYNKMGSHLLVNYGKPIKVSEFYEDYKENPNKAYALLIAKLGEEMKKNMIHIENEKYYDMYMGLIPLYRKKMLRRLALAETPYNKFKADQATISLLDENQDKLNFDILYKRVNEFKELLTRFNFKCWVFEKDSYSVLTIVRDFIGLLLLFPFFVAGAVSNFIPYHIAYKAGSKVKDPQFISSVRFASATVVFFPLYYLLVLVPLLFILPAFWQVLFLGLFMILSGRLAFEYRKWLKKTYAKFRYFRLRKNEYLGKAKTIYKSILDQLDSV